MVGRAIAASTRGCTSEGPGPSKVRTGGLNDLIAEGMGLTTRRAPILKNRRSIKAITQCGNAATLHRKNKYVAAPSPATTERVAIAKRLPSPPSCAGAGGGARRGGRGR